LSDVIYFNADRFRRKAQEFRASAEQLRSAVIRDLVLALADDYERLARWVARAPTERIVGCDQAHMTAAGRTSRSGDSSAHERP
jgi:hypothetical protein